MAKQIRELEMVQHALSARDALKRQSIFPRELTDKAITVEMTGEATAALFSCVDFYTSDIYREHGPITVEGVRFYEVRSLPDGDTWRVLNALGTV